MKVLSLIASSTEMVAALGRENWLVGRSHECDTPKMVRALPEVTRPAFDPHGSSKEIDERVKGRVRDALSIYEVDRQLLKKLQPEVILTQTQCEVCAVSLEDVEAAVADWTGVRPTIISLNSNRLEDIWNDFRAVAKALGSEKIGERKIAELQGRMSAIARITARFPTPQPTVALIEWIEPLMAAGNWMPELVLMAGGVPVFGEAGKHSPWMTMEELTTKNPDVVVISPCGFDIARTKEELHLLTDRPEFRALQAYQNKRVYLADGNQFFNRPGPRVVEALEVLAEILHPRQFDFEREFRGFESIF